MSTMFTIADFNARARQARAEQPDDEAPLVRVSAAEFQALTEHAESRGPTVAARLRDEHKLGRYLLDVPQDSES